MLIWFLFLFPFLPVPTVYGIPVSFVRLAAILIVILWLFRGLLSKKIFLPFSLQSLFLAAFIFFSALSVLWAENPGLTLRKEFLWLAIFPLSLVFWRHIYIHKDTEAAKNNKISLPEAIIFSSGILGFLSVIQFLTQFILGHEAISNFLAKNITPIFVGAPAAEVISQNSSWFVNIEGQTVMRSVVNFPDPHTLALFLGLALPFSIIAAVTSPKKRYLYGIISGLILAGLLCTFSRGAYIALVFSLISIIPFLGYKLRTKKTGIIAIFAVIIFLFLGQPISSRFISSFNASEGSNAGRILIWHKAIEVFEQNPIVGVGLGNYPTTQDEFISARSPVNAHSTYLEIATELGLVGLLLWLGTITTSFWGLFKNARKDTLALAAMGGLVFFSIHGIFETIIYSPQNLILLSFILAIAFKVKDKTKEKITV